MARTEFIRARVSPKAKRTLIALADRSQTTVSHVIRDLIARVQHGGGIDSRSLRQDMATVRQLANTVLSIAEGDPHQPGTLDRLSDAGHRIREVASRHLGSLS